MILKSSILVVAMVSGLFASENPFAIEENIQKIEKEESALLQSISKEKSSLQSDDILEPSAPVQEASAEEKESASAVSQNVPEANISSPVEKSTQPAKETPIINDKIEAKADAVEPKAVEDVKSSDENLSAVKMLPVLVEENQSKPESTKSDTKEVVAVPAVPAQTSEVKNELPLAEKAKSEAADKASTISDDKKKEALQTVESQVEKIDAKIAELEAKLKKSREAVMSGSKNDKDDTSSIEVVKPESVKAVEPPRDSAFEKELQEAIQSVQN